MRTVRSKERARGQNNLWMQSSLGILWTRGGELETDSEPK